MKTLLNTLKNILHLNFTKSSKSNQDYKNIISSASDLMLSKFIVCMCDQDYSGLIIKGNPTNEQLQKAWNKIYDEYLSIIKDKEQSYVMQLTKEVYLLEFKINIINTIVTSLSIRPDVEILKELKRWIPVWGEFNPGDEKKYLEELQLVINQSKRLVIDLQSKTEELNDLIPKEKTNVTRDYFDKLIWQLSKYAKHQINKYTITVSEFAEGLADMRMMNEYLISQQNG
jgi:hypothetical protein